MCIIDIDPGAEGIDIPGEICEFGDYGVVITNLDEFFKRVKNAVGQMNGYDVRMRHVKYSDTPPADLSDIGIVFHKREHYKNEHEYRIAVLTGSDTCDCLILDTGNLEDIAIPIWSNYSEE